MGVELPLRVVVTILECCVTFSGVKLSIRSFVLFQYILNGPNMTFAKFRCYATILLELLQFVTINHLTSDLLHNKFVLKQFI